MPSARTVLRHKSSLCTPDIMVPGQMLLQEAAAEACCARSQRRTNRHYYYHWTIASEPRGNARAVGRIPGGNAPRVHKALALCHGSSPRGLREASRLCVCLSMAHTSSSKGYMDEHGEDLRHDIHQSSVIIW
ncbi:hypothetical protein NHX12_018872 [Muraenolepis orangiensis]|uniref:Uncharacterized protein n=1 Tax=Muraenolepis orangiensis TaxID=630683 RepID=A0A9Q0EY10_9TELE|nr:hypothetical protein NHX12_018872 [Muraenolepis orangiensis]